MVFSLPGTKVQRNEKAWNHVINTQFVLLVSVGFVQFGGGNHVVNFRSRYILRQHCRHCRPVISATDVEWPAPSAVVISGASTLRLPLWWHGGYTLIVCSTDHWSCSWADNKRMCALRKMLMLQQPHVKLALPRHQATPATRINYWPTGPT